MTQISFYKNGTGEFIKQGPNWTGVVPALGDVVFFTMATTTKRNGPIWYDIE